MSGTGNILTLDPQTFRAQFTEFDNPIVNSDANIQLWFDMASNFISTTDWGFLNGTARQNALYLLTAHMMQLQKMAADNGGASPGFVTDATVDKVKVTVQPPPVKSQYGWWLNQTAYGSNLWALLQVIAVGGTYAGGVPELAAFRRVGGLHSGGFRGRGNW